MKVLLDENVPHELRPMLSEHEVFTVRYKGWLGLKNGVLLRTAAEDGFDVLVTLDSGIQFQQNLQNLPIAIVFVRSKQGSMEELIPLLPFIRKALKLLKPKTFVRVPEN